MTGFWRRLFGGQGMTSETAGTPASSRGSAPPSFNKDVGRPIALTAEERAEVLSQFHNGANPEQVPPEAWQDFWRRKLGVPFRQAAKAMFVEGLLREACPEAKLTASRNLVELKALAKKRGLKVSGRKDELAARLAENAGPDLSAELTKTKVWVCSEAARKIVDEHREHKKARLNEVRLETLELLRRKRLKEACERVGEYEEAQFYPRGFGVDWHSASGSMFQTLKAVYAAQPKFHKRRFGPLSPKLRERAAMSILWGTEAFGDLFPKTKLHEQAEQTKLFSRMLNFHASYLRTLRQVKRFANDGLNVQCEIIAVEDQNTTCDACLSDDGQVYSLEDAPELPHEYCECGLGCRCNLVVKFSDDF